MVSADFDRDILCRDTNGLDLDALAAQNINGGQGLKLLEPLCKQYCYHLSFLSFLTVRRKNRRPAGYYPAYALKPPTSPKIGGRT